MKKYARIVDGLVDNIYETNNPITEEFPADQFWVEVVGDTVVDYSFKAVNTNGVWSFDGSPYWQSELGNQLRRERAARLDKVINSVTAAALLAKVDLGLATAADQAYLLAYKQYCVAFSEVNKQPGFPLTIVWPERP
ncbi:tail fiber assembly protein [Pseudomonas frederiksbergensis]|uniref:Tail assembly chaperone n=1 Tax=Pseudomonas frederiksbergensis TaxID=104087 RepID=A0A423KM33_9PSED|nr:tail fiber assembly protein [Pseudomonas frederiksbergensis]RON54942.1 tail assembly chaperone [Pseudomonas frederiksbergensis]